jgi:hypothetical protein
MNTFWGWYAQLPDFASRHPLLGLLISGAILFGMVVVITHPFQVLRLVFGLLFRGIDGIAAASASISTVKGPLPGPTAEPPIGRVENGAATVTGRRSPEGPPLVTEEDTETVRARWRESCVRWLFGGAAVLTGTVVAAYMRGWVGLDMLSGAAVMSGLAVALRNRM